jgi:hypothetical protein
VWGLQSGTAASERPAAKDPSLPIFAGLGGEPSFQHSALVPEISAAGSVGLRVVFGIFGKSLGQETIYKLNRYRVANRTLPAKAARCCADMHIAWCFFYDLICTAS